jgi:hypothetical protein
VVIASLDAPTVHTRLAEIFAWNEAQVE